MSAIPLPISGPWFRIAASDAGATVTVGNPDSVTVSVDVDEGELAFLLPVVMDWLDAVAEDPFQHWRWDDQAGECRPMDLQAWDEERERLARMDIEVLCLEPWIMIFREDERHVLSIRTGLKDKRRIGITEAEAEGILLAIEAALPERWEPDNDGPLTIPLIERAVFDMMPPSWEPEESHPIRLFGHGRTWSRRGLRRITKKQIEAVSKAIDEQRDAILIELLQGQGDYVFKSEGGIWNREPATEPATEQKDELEDLEDAASKDRWLLEEPIADSHWPLLRHLVHRTTDHDEIIGLVKVAAVLHADTLLDCGKSKGGKAVKAVRYRDVAKFLEAVERLLAGTSTNKDWKQLSDAMEDSGDIALRLMAASMYERQCRNEGISAALVDREPLQPLSDGNPFYDKGIDVDPEAVSGLIMHCRMIERQSAEAVRSLGTALYDGADAFAEALEANGTRWGDAVESAKEALAASQLLGLSEKFGLGSAKEVSGKATADLRFAWDCLWIWFEVTYKWPMSTAGSAGFIEFMRLILEAEDNCGVLDDLLTDLADPKKRKKDLYDTLMNATKKSISGFLLQEQWNLTPPHVAIANPMQAKDGRFLSYGESGAGPAGWYTRWRATSSTSLIEKADPDVIRKKALDRHLKSWGSKGNEEEA